MPGKASSKFWVFTLNNPQTAKFDCSVEHWKAIKYMVYQKEIGENGTPHFQGYVELHSTRQLSFMKKLSPQAHWEMRAGTAQQARDYAMKAETRVPGTVPIEIGTFVPPEQGKRTDLLALREALSSPGVNLRKVAEDHFPTWVKYHRGVDRFIDLGRPTKRPDKIEVDFHFGPTNLGKTHYAIHCNEGVKPEEVYIKPAGEWFDGYEGQEVILLDEFKGWLPFHQLLRLLDKYPMQIPVKGGFRPLVCRKVIITSNYLPKDWYSNQKLHWDAFWRRVTMFYHWTGFKCFFQTPNKERFLDSVYGFVDTRPPPDTPPPVDEAPGTPPPAPSPFTEDMEQELMDLDDAIQQDKLEYFNPAHFKNLTLHTGLVDRVRDGYLTTEEFWDSEI